DGRGSSRRREPHERRQRRRVRHALAPLRRRYGAVFPRRAVPDAPLSPRRRRRNDGAHEAARAGGHRGPRGVLEVAVRRSIGLSVAALTASMAATHAHARPMMLGDLREAALPSPPRVLDAPDGIPEGEKVDGISVFAATTGTFELQK